MDKHFKRKIAVATTLYWFMLAYIIGALVWWLVLLQKQNNEITGLRFKQLSSLTDSAGQPPSYNTQKQQILSEHRRNTAKYVGEGATFLVLILIGAVFIYRAVRRQLRIQQQQQNFMMAITHELKTPIAVTKLNLETLQKHHLDENRQMKILQMTLEETNRLNDLTNNILVSSQLEGGRYKGDKEELNLSDLVSSSVQGFARRFPDRKWETDIEEEIELTGDPLLLTILVNNLLENAMKYSPRQLPVLCRLQQQGKKILLEILDQGPGIPDKEKQKIFEKFYRIGNESTRTTKGTGLGLYLCRKIARDHNADIYVTDNTPTGCNFTVSFKS